MPHDKKPGLAPWLTLAATLAAGGAQAAGGHHDVDDANILSPGECSQETWQVRSGRGRNRLHAGANCRVGPVELGIAGEHAREPGQPSETTWFPEVKWAGDVGQGFSVGFDVQAIVQSNARPHYSGLSAYAIVTWMPRGDLAIHANLGTDFERDGPTETRGGIALEWTPLPHWSFVAERYTDHASHSVRAGARFLGGRHWSLDLSRALRVAGPRPSSWTFGLNLDFGRD